MTGFADNQFQSYNNFFVDSLEACYNQVQDFLQIEPPSQHVYSRFVEKNSGGGCAAFYHKTLICGSKKAFVDDILNVWKAGSPPATYPELVKQGKCITPSAQPHELTHWFTEGTPLEYTGLEEGLAEYVKYQVKDEGQNLTCFADHYTVGTFSYPYFDLSKTTYDLSEGYYLTTACIWDYIDKTYGHDKFILIMKELDGLRYTEGEYKFFGDIINPILGEDVIPELEKRFKIKDEVIEVKI